MTYSRKGFTIVELLVVTVLGSLVVLASLQILITNRRTYTAQTSTISGQQTNRMAVEVLFSELREVSPPGGDIIAMASDSLTVRLMRKFSIVCDITLGTDPTLTVLKYHVLNNGDSMQVQTGTNRFAVGDSTFVFADNDPNIDTDDNWILGSVTAVDTAAVVCPQDGTDAVQLTYASQSALFTTDSVGIGAAVRSWQEYTFGTTTMNGDLYLARRDTGAFVPIAGPIADTSGLEFVYRDAEGNVTTTATDVAQVQVTLRTGNEVLNSLGEFDRDSVMVWIYTRN